MNRIRPVYLAVLAALSSAAQAADDDKSSGELETVTVTARYETEDLQKTPIAISTTSSDQLQSANITSMNSLGQLVPNLYTHPGDADESGVPTIVMRGVSQDDASYARAPRSRCTSTMSITQRRSAPSST